MNLKISKLLKISLGLALCGGSVFLGSLIKAEENTSASASSSSYWSTVDPKANADTVFTKLHALVDKNTPTGESGYGDLWDMYQITDKVPGKNKIWDMYGGFQFDFGDKAGTYKKEGDCYNREHSIPKSWWNTVKDERYCDIIHLVPTDGKVNGMRSNYAFGEVSSATYTHNFSAQTDGSGNTIQTAGSSKLGTGKAINGINAPGTVFEPDDQYKGDFARIYYYFSTRYGPKNKIPTYGDGTTIFSTDSDNFYLTSYGRALLNKWHVQDPVSKKETDRNDGVEQTVGVRNPFVDHPEWADKIFGSNYAATHGGGDDTPSISISASSYSMKVDGTITLTANVSNLSGTVLWYVEDSSTDVITLSSTCGNSITVTGVGAGSKKVYAYIGSVNAWVNITVTSSGGGGGGGQGQTGTYTWDLTDDSYETASESEVVWSSECASMTLSKNTSSTKANNYLGGTNSETRFYGSQKLTISPHYGYEISNVTFSCNSTSGFSGSNWDNATCSVNNGTVTVTPTNGTIDFSGVLNGQCKVKTVVVSYGGGSSVEPTLSSISLDTSNVQKVFNIGDTFTYSGLVVTANYSNSNSVVVTPTSVSSPDMSTAGNKTVTVSYTEDGVTQTSTYSITVNPQTINPTSIAAGAVKEFYVGDVITKSDLYVKDNFENEITDFTFANDEYMFKYSDSNPNGDLKVKDFENSVSYNGMTCSLSVVVKRKERAIVDNSVTDTLTCDDFAATSTTYTAFSGVEKDSGAVYAGKSACDNGVNIQLRSKSSDSGIVTTVSGGIISSVTIVVAHGTNRINVYGKNSAYSSVGDLYNSNAVGTLVGYVTDGGTVTFTTPYTFIGIRSNDGAIYISSIEITYGGSDNAKNVANYIMFDDQEGQCIDNFPIAKTYFEGLSIAQRSEFMNSNDYVISCARERLLAWAYHLGKTISQENGDYVIKNSNVNRSVAEELIKDDSSIIIISLLCIGACFGSGLYLCKRKRLSK